MKESPTTVILLGGHIPGPPSHLAYLLQVEQGPILTSFLEKAYRTLRTETALLPRELTSEIPHFSSIADLCVLHSEGRLHHILSQALTCVFQIGYFICVCERNHGTYPESDKSCVSGIDIGALSAAAISVSRNLTQLLHSGIEAIRIAFWTALVAVEAAEGVETSYDSFSSSWTIWIPRISLEETTLIVAEFSERVKTSIPWRLQISRVSEDGVEVSGAPRILSEFQKDASLQAFGVKRRSVPAPYHNSQAFTKDSAFNILNTTLSNALAAYPRNLDLVSVSTGKSSWAQTFRSLLEEAVVGILIEPVRQDLIAQELLARLQNQADTQVDLLSLTAEDDSTYVALRNCGHVALGHPFGSVPWTVPPTSTAMCDRPIAQSKLAIVGFSGRFPSAGDLKSYWDLLYEGQDVHKVAPNSRWDVKTHVDATGKKKNTSKTPFGCWLDDAALFDAKFFHLSPREAPQVDPAQRIALLTAYEALESAGIVPGATPSTQKDRVGVFYGVTSNDWMETNSAQNIDTYMIPGGNRAFIPGRINYFFKFSGPSYSVDTACSSSLAAIHAACNSLWRGDVDTAIAGGTNILTNPDFTAGLDRGHFLSRTGNCKSFDDGADGYCRGEGVCTVILKRYEDAVADSDPIHGLILSACTNHSADAESITRPHGEAQKTILNKLLRNTGTDAYEVSYVEMHGTGTQAGDAEEMRSVVEVFAPEARRPIRKEDQSLYLGSIKANIGHGEAASGVSSLIKVLLMMKHDVIPPHCGIKTKLNHKFPEHMASHNVRIASQPTPWPRPSSGTRKVFINNFSAAGGNSALLLEDASLPSSPVANIDNRTNHVVAVSAKCAKSLKGNIDSLLSYLEITPPTHFTLPALSYTTTARRTHHVLRVMVHGSNLSEIRAKLLTARDVIDSIKRKPGPPVIFSFTGQGSQYATMGKTFYRNFSSFRADIDRFDRLGRSLGFPSFLEVIIAEDRQIEDHSPTVTQLATVCLEMALTRLWRSWGVSPHAVVGHSLGEYAALHAAGVLSEYDTVFLVGKRAQLLEQYCVPGTHSMLAVQCPLETVDGFIQGYDCEISCVNSPEDVVISGPSEMIKKVSAVFRSQHIKATLLNTPYAFHSAQVHAIVGKLVYEATKITPSNPKIPVICATTATVIRSGNTFSSDYFSVHCRGRVNLLGAAQSARQAGILDEKSIIIEIGPQPVVVGMLRKILDSTLPGLPSLQYGKDPWVLISTALSTLYMRGISIDWREYHRNFQTSHKVLQLPSYSWDLKEYWIQYTNDWSLFKGEATSVITAKKDSTPSLHTSSPSLERTTIHKISHEDVGPRHGRIVVEGDISRADLNPLVQGHKVNGIPLCTPSVYAELALSIGTHLLQHYQPHMMERLIDVSNMVIEKALIAQDSGSQMLRTSVDVNWITKEAFCSFESYNEASKRPARHATCTIVFKNDEKERARLICVDPMIRERVAILKSGLSEGRVFRFNRSMVYKMVGGLAQFDKNYMGINEIVLDSNALEAYGSVKFSGMKLEGSFHTHPALIDALSQIAGFVMNCNDKSDLEKEVFINHGWGSFKLFDQLSEQKSYQMHVSMHEASGNKWEGNITILGDTSIVATFGNIVLQAVRKQALQFILAREKDLATSPSVKQSRSSNPASSKHIIVSQANQLLPDSLKIAPIEVDGSLNTSLVNSVSPRDNGTVSSTRVTTEISRLFESALQIISEESGIDRLEMTDSSILSEMGIDSLLILIISSRFIEELELDLDSAQLATIPTIKDLKQALSKSEAEETLDVQGRDYPDGKERESPFLSHLETSDLSSQLRHHTTFVQSATSEQNMGMQRFQHALQIISEESGVAVSELTDETSFADIGVDSLLSLIVGSRFKDEVLMELETDQSLFVQFPTLYDIRNHFEGETRHSRDPEGDPSDTHVVFPADNESSQESEDFSSVSDRLNNKLDMRAISTSPLSTLSPSRERSPASKPRRRIPAKPATSIVLQGKPRIDPSTLILFPDGGGSAASYTQLPRIHPKLAVIGLNSPYYRCPSEMTCHLDELIDSYLNEIRKRQPNGPYNLGGWSSGGILAYKATQRFIQEGEEVSRLVLIDSPPPAGLDRLPQRFYDLCSTVNLFDSVPRVQEDRQTSPPAELLAHFVANIEILHDYYGDPLPEGFTPQTTIIWASECVFDAGRVEKLQPSPDDTDGMKFLTEKRTDFTAGKWEELFPGDVVTVEVLEGAHHFSMVGDQAHRLAPYIECAMR